MLRKSRDNSSETIFSEVTRASGKISFSYLQWFKSYSILSVCLVGRGEEGRNFAVADVRRLNRSTVEFNWSKMRGQLNNAIAPVGWF